jgi:hypothetical protein
MERASGAWMVPVKPHGWVHAALVMGVARLSASQVNIRHYKKNLFSRPERPEKVTSLSVGSIKKGSAAFVKYFKVPLYL